MADRRLAHNTGDLLAVSGSPPLDEALPHCVSSALTARERRAKAVDVGPAPRRPPCRTGGRGVVAFGAAGRTRVSPTKSWTVQRGHDSTIRLGSLNLAQASAGCATNDAARHGPTYRPSCSGRRADQATAISTSAFQTGCHARPDDFSRRGSRIRDANDREIFFRDDLDGRKRRG